MIVDRTRKLTIGTRISLAIGLIALVGLAACAGETEMARKFGATRENQPDQSLLTMESKFACLRIAGPGGMSGTYLGLTEPRLAPGGHTARSDVEWKSLWNAAGQRPNTDPPMALPEGYVVIAITVNGGEQAHPHIRRIAERPDAITFEIQLEVRNFPVRDGQRMAIADGDYLDTLVIFYPRGSATTFKFEALPVLVWTPEKEADVRSKPACSYYP